MQPSVALGYGFGGGGGGDAGTDELRWHANGYIPVVSIFNSHVVSLHGHVGMAVAEARRRSTCLWTRAIRRSYPQGPAFVCRVGLNVTRPPLCRALALIALAIANDLAAGCALLARYLRGGLRGLAIQVMLLRMAAPSHCPSRQIRWMRWTVSSARPASSRHPDTAAHDLEAMWCTHCGARTGARLGTHTLEFRQLTPSTRESSVSSTHEGLALASS